ncbi:DUF58 domain-containing protein [Gracilinema caldarium]|uniref:Uncharacterized protein n=1 Tax=Gracilinema caldarium (strain ATCC 51460 / DSM 7334 / H1) TaxID=744872 RepID=F8F3A9_GRAC1|nr:DUF58 domain-containing protein [Gracilinema caldarium]AEJ20946.1 protein of unknown function DUF58 [Gracilinema caldarium DSM 7334]
MKTVKSMISNKTSHIELTITSWAVAMIMLITGLFLKESVLTLIGLFSLFVLSYALMSILVLTLLSREVIKGLSYVIIPEDAPAGDPIEFILRIISTNLSFCFKLAGVIAFCEIRLSTRDNKAIEAILPLSSTVIQKGIDSFHITTNPASRGVYVPEYAQVSLYDVFGFYHIAIPLIHKTTEELILRPKPAQNGTPITFHSGGTTHREEQTYQRTEELTEHRPYVPGDDPRRINWKLFGHSGDLFIRQGEQEPPPVAEYVLVLDTSIDYTIFSQEEGRLLVDGICQEALTLALELSRKRYAITLCYPGSALLSADESTISRLLAYPVAIDITFAQPFPVIPPSTSLLIISIPRTIQQNSTLLDEILSRPAQAKKVTFINPTKLLATSKYQNYYEAIIRYYGQVHGT